MKLVRLLVLCVAAFMGSAAYAQIDETLQFVDKDGNVVPDGSTITVTDAVDDFKKIVGEDAAVTVYLIEDGLEGTQKSATGVVYDFIHNDVLRDVVTNNVYGDALNWTGATSYQNEFNVTLDSSWKPENMRIVAFIGRPVTDSSAIDDIWVNNTNMVKLGETTAIEGPATSDDANVKEIARYTVDGRKVSEPVKGLNIIKLSDGRTIKVNVK